ncbi:hypothetical protein BCR35DRAFT_303274 [Leucosporidium creatinivorum]|uniref:Uncharacterized protein n=1 Tax=Leucosporidium creatinivorum TaxID=106004 RepID=A0A1Y2FN83_9BASI|nr:hypothetical protein BCR35DRAFT_303274 [Leucosporidium creatinivorum]
MYSTTSSNPSLQFAPSIKLSQQLEQLRNHPPPHAQASPSRCSPSIQSPTQSRHYPTSFPTVLHSLRLFKSLHRVTNWVE